MYVFYISIIFNIILSSYTWNSVKYHVIVQLKYKTQTLTWKTCILKFTRYLFCTRQLVCTANVKERMTWDCCFLWTYILLKMVKIGWHVLGQWGCVFWKGLPIGNANWYMHWNAGRGTYIHAGAPDYRTMNTAVIT